MSPIAESEEFPDNTHKAREAKQQPKEIQKIVKGSAVNRRKPLGRKIKDTFTGEDVNTVGGYLLLEVFVPAVKTMLADLTREGVERVLFGSGHRGGNSYNRPPQGGTRTNYNTMYGGRSHPAGRAGGRPTQRPQVRRSNEMEEIVLERRGDAEDVLEKLIMLIEQYDAVTVSDLKELVGITGSFTDDKWGWFDLRDARVVRVREGHLLDLPPAQPID